MKQYIIMLLSLMCLLEAKATDKITGIQALLKNVSDFTTILPQEKVYLHLDNTSYHFGDDIWFKAYVVNADDNKPTGISGTLYVELLNPGGEVVTTKILKVGNGGCDGNISINKLPFYPGYYEVRAYTKYMLNYGGDVIYSRVIPIFEASEDGKYKQEELPRVDPYLHTVKRELPKKGEDVNLCFYPEGGYLVNGADAMVAFESVDGQGNPIDVQGKVVDATGAEVTTFSTRHEGKGKFLLPAPHPKMKAVVTYGGKDYTSLIPRPVPAGYAMRVDNLSSADSVRVTIRQAGYVGADTIGVAVLGMGRLCKSYILVVDDRPIEVAIDKGVLPTGVSTIILFNSQGQKYCERKVFVNRDGNRIGLSATFDKAAYGPFEDANVKFAVADVGSVQSPIHFSVSIRDHKGELDCHRNAMADLLLMSEIRGYVANPEYYFESDDARHRGDLDLLMMTQGWTRYPWEMLCGQQQFDLAFTPEAKGIETAGEVISFLTKQPKADMNLSVMMTRQDADSTMKVSPLFDMVRTDKDGKFRFVTNVTGSWDAIFSVRKDEKKKDYIVKINRLFSPEPRGYRFPDMELRTSPSVIEGETVSVAQADTIMEKDDARPITNDIEKVIELDELEVNASKHSIQREIYEARKSALVRYDIPQTLDEITDRGDLYKDDLYDHLTNLNKNFTLEFRDYDGENGSGTPSLHLFYKNRRPLFVVNYNADRNDSNFSLDQIKTLYVSEDGGSIVKYAPDDMRSNAEYVYGCVVFIETYPDDHTPVKADRGARKTVLQCYDEHKEFYNVDYSLMKPNPDDYRRTLYWNPNVVTDEDGVADIRFYNNGTATSFTVDAQTVTPDGRFVVLKQQFRP